MAAASATSAVRDRQVLGDQKRGGAHDRRHDLAAVGRHGLDGGGQVRRIAGALHHGDGDRAVDDDVGHRAARDHAVEAGGHDRHLGRPAAVAAHRHQRHVGQELVAADGVERLAEEDVGDDDGGGDRQRQPENAVGVEVEIDDDAAPARALGVEHAGQQPGEVRVEQARQADPHQRPAGQPAHALQHEQDDGAAEQDLVPGEQAELVGDRRIQDGDVAADHEAGHDAGSSRTTAPRRAAPAGAP